MTNTDRPKQPQADEIEVSAVVRYVAKDSRPEDDRYVFAYTITISNHGCESAQLLDRHWIIANGDGEEHEVRGDGVVGEQPHIGQGEQYQYTSGAVLTSEVGSMRGSYGFCTPQGARFEVAIPPFSLARPRAVH